MARITAWWIHRANWTRIRPTLQLSQVRVAKRDNRSRQGDKEDPSWMVSLQLRITKPWHQALLARRRRESQSQHSNRIKKLSRSTRIFGTPWLPSDLLSAFQLSMRRCPLLCFSSFRDLIKTKRQLSDQHAKMKLNFWKELFWCFNLPISSCFLHAYSERCTAPLAENVRRSWEFWRSFATLFTSVSSWDPSMLSPWS